MDNSAVLSSPMAANTQSIIESSQCADCSSEDPQWASITRGVLICSDCCSVHRNLGRHISHVRHLKKGMWDTPQLDLVKMLHRSGSNRIWEHALMDPATALKHKKKPTAFDPIFPTKEAFIKAKYVDHAFMMQNRREAENYSVEDLNRQLWSCVRTGHVDTTLRLLAWGADPNFVSDTDNYDSAMHVAAKEGQSMQVELLFIYGADPMQANAQGKRPSQYARDQGYLELANRIEELCFDLTNRLSLFLCGRKPDHQHKQHFLIPELTGKSALDGLRPIRRQLQTLPNSVFAKITQDVYDEVDRRESHAAWVSTHKNQGGINELCVAVFLPLNPSFSATRNQLRQKLAKYDVREFAALVIDILKEAKRRYLGEPLEEDPNDLSHSNHNTSGISGLMSGILSADGRDYDDVAEYARSPMRHSGATRGSSGNKTRSTNSMDGDSRPTIDDILELKERMNDNEMKMLTLTNTNAQILKVLSSLQNSMEKIRTENTCLKNEISRLVEQQTQASRRLPSPATVHHHPINNNIGERAHSVGLEKHSRPLHNNDDLRLQGQRHGSLTTTQPLVISQQSRMHSGRMSADHYRKDSGRSRDRESSRERQPRDTSREVPIRRERLPSFDHIASSPSLTASKIQEAFSEQTYPDNLIRETEGLTVAIRSLLTDAQHKQLPQTAAEHAYKIASLINHIISLIPHDMRVGDTKKAVDALMDATVVGYFQSFEK
ncbi:hypothetical protein WR25_18942 isoform C [Diploscapter pachys]|uniref:Arf-GAP domain-containing protein n=2 Tax=Diploscapter pachys TaxID=2018661 RepID=A0A2A2K909_9BILA|nr:hypothetical protein WR25_18942 isoform C [Diploscapter pachys]